MVMLAGDVQRKHYVRTKCHEAQACEYDNAFPSQLNQIIIPYLILFFLLSTSWTQALEADLLAVN